MLDIKLDKELDHIKKCCMLLTRLGLRNVRQAYRTCQTKQDSADSIKNILNKSQSKIVVFMKGNKESPRCGFSNAVVKILEMHGADFKDIDVLEDESIRKGIKEYSNWPTIPQVYINKEFVGGCDILLQMHKNGELVEELKKAGIISKLT